MTLRYGWWDDAGGAGGGRGGSCCHCGGGKWLGLLAAKHPWPFQYLEYNRTGCKLRRWQEEFVMPAAACCGLDSPQSRPGASSSARLIYPPRCAILLPSTSSPADRPPSAGARSPCRLSPTRAGHLHNFWSLWLQRGSMDGRGEAPLDLEPVLTCDEELMPASEARRLSWRYCFVGAFLLPW